MQDEEEHATMCERKPRIWSGVRYEVEMRIVYEGGEGEIVEKKSRFIATVRPISTEEEATAFVNEMKKKYWDARHNCSAFTIGEHHETCRCSDDGEPGQTAGRPMLDVLLREDIHNVAVVVTRYFGGTLLGTGGLVRAYQGATQEGLRASHIIDRQVGTELILATDYTGMGKIQYLLGKRNLSIMDTIYTDSVELHVLVPNEERENLTKEIIEATNGTAGISWGEEKFFAIDEKKLLIL